MQLQTLFETQKALDERIVKEHNLEGRNLLLDKILALLVELGELANETRCFKFWSDKPASSPRIILEEFVDGIHFFISIANDLQVKPENFVVTCDYTKETLTETFTEVYANVTVLYALLDVDIPATITDEDLGSTLHEAFSCYMGLGEKFLGFTWEQIEQAYFEKNKINHERQESGY